MKAGNETKHLLGASHTLYFNAQLLHVAKTGET